MPSLQHGPYLSPPVIKGCRVTCLVRGVVKLVGLSNAAIPWPVGEREGEQELVVYRGLARALQMESADAVAEAWGVPAAKIKAWQAAVEKHAKHVPGSNWKKRPWTLVENKALLATDNIRTFAKQHGRTVAACRYHRWVLRIKYPIAADRMQKPARKRRKP
jgi:hypothetical protein